MFYKERIARSLQLSYPNATAFLQNSLFLDFSYEIGQY